MDDAKTSRNVLIYDAECRLCVASKEWVARWDRYHRISFLPFQTAEAKERVPELAGLACMDAMRFIDAQGTVTAGVEAFRRMLPLLPFGRPLSLLFHIPGVPQLAAKVYHHVAENRYRWFGRAF
jgi:predicted DCC family thiol-disulfide oxidoreductase YuxK